MGGSAGISVNGGYRIATERTFAILRPVLVYSPMSGDRFNRCPGHRTLSRSDQRRRPRGGAAGAPEFVPHSSCRASWRWQIEIWEARGEQRQIRCAQALRPRIIPGAAPLRIAAVDRPVQGGFVEKSSTRRRWARAGRAPHGLRRPGRDC
jgi:hypothetical protein